MWAELRPSQKEIADGERTFSGKATTCTETMFPWREAPAPTKGMRGLVPDCGPQSETPVTKGSGVLNERGWGGIAVSHL